jgi:tryptophan synthase alpha subunit
VVAGFGIEDAGDVARLLGTGVDGVVVGSAGIRALRDGGTPGLRAFLRPIVAAARAHPSAASA